MSLVSVPNLLLPSWPQLGGIGSTGSSSGTHDAVGEGYGAVFMPPKAGNIRTIGMRFYLVSSPVMEVSIGIYGVDGNGLPDLANPIGGMSPATKNSGFNTTWFEVTLAADAVISDLTTPICVVCHITDYTSGYFRGEHPPILNQTGIPYGVSNQGSWGKGAEGMPFIIKYSDGSIAYIPGTMIGVTASQSSVATNVAYGMKMTMPFACRAVGCVTRHFPQYNLRNHRAVLYDSVNSVLGQAHRYQNVYDYPSGGNVQIQSMFEGGAVTLAKDDVVRLVVLNDDAGSIDMYNWSCYATLDDALQQMLGPSYGGNITSTWRSGGGAWTDAGNTNRMMMSLILDQIDVPGGGVAMPGAGGLIR